MKIRLPIELEQAIIRGVTEGILKPWQVKPKEFSSTGESIFEAVKHYIDKGGELPVSLDTIKEYVVQVGQLGPEDMDYFTDLRKSPTGVGLDKVLDLARRKQILSYVIEAAGDDLAEGEFNPDRIKKILEHYESTSTFEPLGSNLDGVMPTPPQGVNLETFPKLSAATGGLVGFWIVGGEPGLGKSTFAWQLGMEYARGAERNVIYYDIDATGREWLIYRTWLMCGKDLNKTRDYLSRIYLRPSIKFMEDDLRKIAPPALIVVDSLQTLPTRSGQRRESLDRWLVRLKDKVNQGYDVLAVSEKNRDSYDKEPSMKSFKETGEIEYACSVGLVFKGDPEFPEDPIGLHLVKNRHGNKRGYITRLERRKDVIWAFKEGK